MPSPGTCAIMGRLCLIVGLWQAPIPWVHCHGSDLLEIQSSMSASDLSRHLARFHQDCAENPLKDYGWHCHWVLPLWGPDSDQPTPSNSSSFLEMTFNLMAVSPACSARGQGTMMPGFWPAELMPRWRTSMAKVETHLNGLWQVPLQQMNSVLRC